MLTYKTGGIFIGGVQGVKKPSDIGPPRKFYFLTLTGQAELEKFWEKWNFVSEKINELKEVSI